MTGPRRKHVFLASGPVLLGHDSAHEQNHDVFLDVRASFMRVERQKHKGWCADPTNKRESGARPPLRISLSSEFPVFDVIASGAMTDLRRAAKPGRPKMTDSYLRSPCAVACENMVSTVPPQTGVRPSLTQESLWRYVSPPDGPTPLSTDIILLA